MNDQTNLEICLEKRDFEGVKKIINNIVSEKMSDDEKGSVLVDTALAYVEIRNNINSKYKAVLDEVIKSLQMLKKSESRFGDKVRIGEIRADMKK